MMKPSRGLRVLAATADADALAGATEVAHALAANLRYLRRRPAAARTPDEPAPSPEIFDVVDAGADLPDEPDYPVVIVAGAAATSVDVFDGVVGVIARATPRPTSDAPVLGVFPPVQGAGPGDPMWIGKAADHLESRVDLWPILQLAAPGAQG